MHTGVVLVYTWETSYALNIGEAFGGLCGEMVQPWPCVHKVVDWNPGRDVWFITAFSEIFGDHRLS